MDVWLVLGVFALVLVAGLAGLIGLALWHYSLYIRSEYTRRDS